MIPHGSTSVMSRRVEPPNSLDFFPTPPWATRALFRHVLHPQMLVTRGMRAWEPACGEGHMAEVLKEEFRTVWASDVFDYGYGEVVDFLGDTPKPDCDWIITNPPFKVAADFAVKGIGLARSGVALLVRSVWLEGVDRYERIFKPHPPTYVAQFVERVPMVKGRWDPGASTATSYAWVIWCQIEEGTALTWIPPGCRRDLTQRDDVRRFSTAAWGDEVGKFGGAA